MRPELRRWLALLAIVLAMAMDLLDLTIVNIAVPTLMANFGADVAAIQWVSTGYILTVGLMIPLSGYLADRLGLRRAFVGAVAVFTAGSLLCSVAPSLAMLIAARVLQGVGGGLLMPLAMLAVLRLFPTRELTLAMGAVGIALLVAPALGPVIGGYIVQFQSWRLIFWVNVPVGLLAIGGVQLFLTEGRTVQRPLDTLGFALGAAGLAALLIALGSAPTAGFTAPYVLLLLVGGGGATLAFIAWEAGQPRPLVDLGVLRRPAFSAASAVTALTIGAIMATMFFLPIYLQEVVGLPPFTAGLMLLPEAVTAALAAPLSSLLLRRVPASLLTGAGVLALAAGTFSLTRLGGVATPGSLFGPLLLIGLGMAFATMPGVTLGLSVLDEGESASGTTILNMVRQVAAAFVIAILAGVLSADTAAAAGALQGDLTPLGAAARYLQTLTVYLQGHGVDAARAQAMARLDLGGALTQDALRQGLETVFGWSAVIALAALPWALFVRQRPAAPQRRAALVVLRRRLGRPLGLRGRLRLRPRRARPLGT